MTPTPEVRSPRDVVRDLYVAVGRLQLRSDVEVTALSRVGRQPFQKLELPEGLTALFREVGALHFAWNFADDPGAGGGLNLMGASSVGWWDASYSPPVVWPMRDGTRDGFPGEQVVTVAGSESSGVLLRSNGGLAYFDGHEGVEPIAGDLAWLQMGVQQQFAHGWDSPRGATVAVRERLQAAAAPRETIEVAVAELERLEGDAARHWLLGSWPQYQWTAVAKVLRVKGSYTKLPVEERGRLLAEAVDAAKVDAKTRTALMKAFGGKSDAKAFDGRFLMRGAGPITRLRLDLSFLVPAGAKHFNVGRTLAARVLFDAGADFGDLDVDAVRFVPDDHHALSAWLPAVTRLAAPSGKSVSAQLDCALSEGVKHTLTAGQTWRASVIEPLAPLV